MSLLLRINAALVPAALVCAAIAAWVCAATLQANARRQVLGEAALMMDSAVAMRAYTANEIDPLLTERLTRELVPQSIPFYAATQNFLTLRERHPQYAYREATLNPTNPRDRATDWEADIIERFRNDPKATEFAGERETPMGPLLYLARPIVAEPECLSCHGLAANGPRTLIARYGSDNGFGWQPHEVVGAHIVSVPLASAQARANRSFAALVGTFAVLLLALVLIANALIYLLLLRPLRRTIHSAERLSLADASAPPFPAGRGEIGELGRAFQRMRVSLEKAMRMLEH